MNIIFTETQYFNQFFLLVILFIVALVPMFFFTFILVKKNNSLVKAIKKYISTKVLIISSCIIYLYGISIITFYLSMKLETKISNEGIHIQFYPFQRKEQSIKWNEIEFIYIRKYNAIQEYGGWGIRINKKGKAYNVKGNRGIQLILKNKTNILIGTQKPDEIQNVLKEINETNNK